MQSFLTKEVPLEALVELQWYLNPGLSKSSCPKRCESPKAPAVAGGVQSLPTSQCLKAAQSLAPRDPAILTEETS